MTGRRHSEGKQGRGERRLRSVPTGADAERSELASAALNCPALSTAIGLAGWTGERRKLTSSLVPRPAEAAEAAQAAGLDIPEGLRIRAARDVPGLVACWEAATRIGFLEIDGQHASTGELYKVLQADDSDESVLELWQLVFMARCTDAGSPAGPVSFDPAGPAALLALRALGDEDGPLRRRTLERMLHDMVLGDDEGDELAELVTSKQIVAAGLKLLEELGVATYDGETAKILPLGRWAASQLESVGGAVIDPDAEAEALLSGVAERPAELAPFAAGAWLDARSPYQAATELLGAAAGGPQRRQVALEIIRSVLGPAAREVWREWVEHPTLGPYARLCLAEDGEDVTITQEDGDWISVDLCASVLHDVSDPPGTLSELESVAEAVDFLLQRIDPGLLERLDRVDHPDIKLVSTALLSAPGDTAPGDAAPGDAAPGDAAPGDAVPGDAVPELGHTPPAGTGTDTSGKTTRTDKGDRQRKTVTVYQLKIQLKGITKPPVWRRVLVPTDIRLSDLHAVIQAVFGWDDSHMHAFDLGYAEFGVSNPELGHEDESRKRLSDVTGVAGRFTYIYDFGDDWEHLITVEKELPAQADAYYPTCTAGKGACPPEDCGGPWGYTDLKAVLADPDDDSHQEMLEWLGLDDGGDFDPTEFDVDEADGDLYNLEL